MYITNLMRYHLGEYSQLRILPIDDTVACIYMLHQLDHTHSIVDLVVIDLETNELCPLNDVGNKYMANMAKDYCISYQGKEVMKLQSHRLWKRV